MTNIIQNIGSSSYGSHQDGVWVKIYLQGKTPNTGNRPVYSWIMRIIMGKKYLYWFNRTIWRSYYKKLHHMKTTTHISIVLFKVTVGRFRQIIFLEMIRRKVVHTIIFSLKNEISRYLPVLRLKLIVHDDAREQCC